ncbi:MAG: hypothetical protein K2K93_00725, partial [Muribaculaceae bacterium]|nr:hypothetical protein [Muribaculaceae bacterium]
MRAIRFFLIAAAFCSVAAGHAKINRSWSYEEMAKDIEAEFDSISMDIESEFDRLLEELNDEYIEMLGEPWQSHEARKEEKKSFTPKPAKPSSPQESATPENKKIDYGKVIPADRPLPDIPATLPKPGSSVNVSYPNKLLFYNTP